MNPGPGDALDALARGTLLALAEGLRAGRIGEPFGAEVIARHAPLEVAEAIAALLGAWHADGMAPRHMASCLELVARERLRSQSAEDRLELVWSPPELDRIDCRDTAVVVQDLFGRASHSLLIATYALDQGERAEVLFGALAARMDRDPALHVRLVGNIPRAHQDVTPADVLEREFAARFVARVWPGRRLPEVFFDPRALSLEPGPRAVMHAKCVVADERWTFVTSANFTEAAQLRNVELGALVDDAALGRRIVRQVEQLVDEGALRAVALRSGQLPGS